MEYIRKTHLPSFTKTAFTGCLQTAIDSYIYSIFLFIKRYRRIFSLRCGLRINPKNFSRLRYE